VAANMDDRTSYGIPDEGPEEIIVAGECRGAEPANGAFLLACAISLLSKFATRLLRSPCNHKQRASCHYEEGEGLKQSQLI